MTIELVTDHEDQGVALLITQFRDKPLIEIMLRALLEQVQEAENALFALLIERTIDTAVGAQLDVIGKIVGQSRGTFDEDTYRTFIRGRVLVNRSSGTTDQMVEIVNTLLPDGVSLRVKEYYPAAFQLEVTSSISDGLGNAIAAIVLEAKALGIAPHFLWFNGPAVFRMAQPGDSIPSPNGFGNGVFAAGSIGTAPVSVVPALDFSDANNSQFLGVI